MLRRRIALTTIMLMMLLSVSSRAELIVHYTFDDTDVDGDTVMDVSGNNLHGTRMNDGPVTGVAGVLGQAVSFGGGSNNDDNHYIDMSEHIDGFGTLSEGTLAAWIKPVTTEEAGPDGHLTDVLTIFSASDQDQGSTEMRWVVHTATSPFAPGGPGSNVEHGSQYLGVRGADFSDHIVSDVADDVSLLDGEWHHVAATVDGDNVGALYIDGTLVDSYFVNGTDIISFMGDLLPDGPNTASIGRNKDSTAGGGQWFYHGLIDDFRIYDSALMEDEIMALFSAVSTGIDCDFNADGQLDILDLNLVAAESLAGTNNLQYDVNADGAVTPADVAALVTDADKLNTWIGDANLDGVFDSSDFVTVFQPGKFETGEAAGWDEGDWNTDGQFNSSDFVTAFGDGGFELGAKTATASVPEPTSGWCVLLGFLAVRIRRRTLTVVNR